MQEERRHARTWCVVCVWVHRVWSTTHSRRYTECRETSPSPPHAPTRSNTNTPATALNTAATPVFSSRIKPRAS